MEGHDADRLAQCVLQAYTGLPAKGKPQGKEHGIVAAVVLEVPATTSSSATSTPHAHSTPPSGPNELCGHTTTTTTSTFHTIALGTGSGCVSAAKLSPSGTALHDGHAEVICKRSFQRWLYDEASAILNLDNTEPKQDSTSSSPPLITLQHPDAPFSLKNRLVLRGKIHFFTTQRPCGDCCVEGSIREGNEREEEKERNHKRRRLNSTTTGVSPEEQDRSFQSVSSNEKEIPNRSYSKTTGARRVLWCPNEEFCRDLGEVVFPEKTIETAILADIGDGTIGALRNKPGRGPLSTSMSCSDKLSRWRLFGLQGTLLSLFYLPLHIESLTISEELSPSQLTAVSRSLTRCVSKEIPVFSSKIRFPQTDPTALASQRIMCGFSLGSWWKKREEEGTVDVTVSCTGVPAGATKKAVTSGRAVSKLAPIKMWQGFCSLVKVVRWESNIEVGGGGGGGGGGNADGPESTQWSCTKEAKTKVRLLLGEGVVQTHQNAFANDGPLRDWVRKDLC